MVESPSRLILEVRTVTGFGGGPDKTIINSPKYLEGLGYQTLVVFLHPPGDEKVHTLIRRAEEREVDVVAVPDRGPLDRKSFLELVRICRDRRPAIWHAHDDKTNVWGWLARAFYPSMKLVTTAHGWWADMGVNPLKRKFFFFCSKQALRRYDHCIAVSHDLDELFGQWGIDRSKRSLIENAIETDRFSRVLSRQEAKARMGLPAESLVFGGLGRLAKEKNFIAMIQAVCNLRPRIPQICLVIAGEGAERQELEACIERNQAKNYIRLLGYQEDPRLMLQAIDAFILNSFTEGLPNVLLEALALETPVISTRVAAVPKMIDDLQHGILIDIDNREQLEDAMCRLAESPELRTQLGVQGKKRVIERYDFRKRMGKIAELYDTILKDSK